MTRRHRGLALLALLALLAAPAAAAPPAPDTPEGVLSFARTLLAGGESYRAATEFLRFLHHYPEREEAPLALEGLGCAYAQAGRWDEAAAAFRQLQQRQPGESSRRLLGAALYRGGRYTSAADLLLDPAQDSADPTLGTLAALRAGEVDRPGVRTDLVRDWQALERKSPGGAGLLAAVLPGAGHLYTGRPRDATISLVLNGAFLWGTYEAARREQWALAGVLGAFELAWYSGNIVSAVNAAHKWNRREEGRFLRLWEDAAVPRWGLTLAPGWVGGQLAWRW